MKFPAPGRFLLVGRRRIHVKESGAGDVPVVLESGLAASSLSWALVQDELAAWTHVVSYDRAGLGWSDAGPKTVTLDGLLADLSLVVNEAGGGGPVVLAGHSFGGLISLAFAAQYPERVAGLVLVDPMSVRYWSACSESDKKRLLTGARLARRGAWLASVGVVRLCLAMVGSGRVRLPKLIANTAGGKGKGLVSRLTGEMSRLPRPLWPVLMSHWSRAVSFRTMAAYLDALPGCAGQGMRLPARRASIPVTVLSAGSATAGELSEREQWVAQSDRGRHIQLEHATHWIQLQDPGAVTASVREMMALVGRADG